MRSSLASALFILTALTACTANEAEAEAASEVEQQEASTPDGMLDGMDEMNEPIEQLEADINNRSPSAYYILASRLFQAGEKDRAVFWFYAGQLRWRTRLSCVEGLSPDGEPALLSSLNYVLGESINSYIGGYPSRWVQTIRNVAEWDAAPENAYDYGQDCAQQNHEQRKGMLKLADNIEQNREEIIKQRTANGLPNHEQ